MELRSWTRQVAALGTCVVAVGTFSTSARAADYWTVLALVRDEKAQEVPIRYGDTTLGYTKACQLHNFCNVAYMTATIAGTGDSSDTGHVVGGEAGDITLIVVADLNRRTQRGDTPDSRAVGMITAYCLGPPRCPDAVNRSS